MDQALTVLVGKTHQSGDRLEREVAGDVGHEVARV
jgi:hypothetical protein